MGRMKQIRADARHDQKLYSSAPIRPLRGIRGPIRKGDKLRMGQVQQIRADAKHDQKLYSSAPIRPIRDHPWSNPEG
jgi:hypothetical protein